VIRILSVSTPVDLGGGADGFGPAVPAAQEADVTRSWRGDPAGTN
jgi:hypothetical protein